MPNENKMKKKLGRLIPPIGGIVLASVVFPRWLRAQSASLMVQVRSGTYDLLE